MKSHRLIWSLVGAVVIAAVTIVAVRDVRAPVTDLPAGPMTEVARQLSPAQIQIPIDALKSCLEKDPQARRANTRALVQEVAALAEMKHLETADTYYALGVYRCTRRDFAGAEAAFRKAVELRPDWKWGYNQLGIVLHSLNRTGDAEAMFRKAIALDQNWGRPHNDLAILLRLTGRLEEAEQEARRALALDPDSVAAHNNYGNLLVAMKRYDEAEREYRRAIQLEPDHPAPYYNLACLASLQGHHEEVVPLLLCAIEFDPSYREEARHDEDFDPVRTDTAFQLLVGAP